MARTRSLTRLTDEEANNFRVFVRAARESKHITNEQIAEFLDWEYDRLVNCLKSGRPLLAESALCIHGALAQMQTHAGSDVMLPFATAPPTWFRAFKTSKLPPRVLIPRESIEDFVEMLIAEVSRRPSIGKASIAELRKSISRVLGRDGAEMASLWYEVTARSVHQLVADIEAGRVICEDPIGRSVTKATPTYFAREVIFMAAALSYPIEDER